MNPRILTVDDSKTIRQMLAGAFEPFHCDVLGASNGIEGLEVARASRPDLIILDYTMPKMDGFEMLTQMKADPALRKIPVIMLTAEAAHPIVLRCSKAGVKDYLIKPFKRELILQRVRRIIDLQPRDEPPLDSKTQDHGTTGAAFARKNASTHAISAP